MSTNELEQATDCAHLQPNRRDTGTFCETGFNIVDDRGPQKLMAVDFVWMFPEESL